MARIKLTNEKRERITRELYEHIYNNYLTSEYGEEMCEAIEDLRADMICNYKINGLPAAVPVLEDFDMIYELKEYTFTRGRFPKCAIFKFVLQTPLLIPCFTSSSVRDKYIEESLVSCGAANNASLNIIFKHVAIIQAYVNDIKCTLDNVNTVKQFLDVYPKLTSFVEDALNITACSEAGRVPESILG